MLNLVVTDLAEQDLLEAYQWWHDHRSAEQAARWFRAIDRAIRGIPEVARQCPRAAEASQLSTDVREALFGLGRRPTHRIVFSLDTSTVTVLRVRHVSQDALPADELGE